MSDEVQRDLDYNLWPWRRRWPEASSMSSDGKSVTVLNSQHRETVMPFISDTKQQKGKLNTPVDPLTQELSFISPFPDFESGVFLSVILNREALALDLEAEAEADLFEPSNSQHRETVMPFISDTKQQKGKLNTPVDPLTQDFSGIEDTLSFNMITSPFPDLKIRVSSVMLDELHLELKRLNVQLKRLNALGALDALGALEALNQELKVFIFRLMRTANFKKAMAFLPFSMNELVSLLKSIRSGWGPPLEMAARMLNSKFWVMEADVWADLLIVCCWANPTIYMYCEKCRNNVKLATTSCKHVVCPVCTVGQGDDPSCPECGRALTVSFSRKRRLCEPPTTATKRPCTDSGTSMVTRSRSKTAKPKPQRKPVSTIPLTTPDVQRPTPPASTGSCSHESRSKSFTTDNFNELLEYLYPAAVNEWHDLGLALGLHVDILEAIATKQRDNCKDCLKYMLIKRLRTKNLSKEELIQSLQKPIVGLSELAQTLKDSKQW